MHWSHKNLDQAKQALLRDTLGPSQEEIDNIIDRVTQVHQALRTAFIETKGGAPYHVRVYKTPQTYRIHLTIEDGGRERAIKRFSVNYENGIFEYDSGRKTTRDVTEVMRFIGERARRDYTPAFFEKFVAALKDTSSVPAPKKGTAAKPSR